MGVTSITMERKTSLKSKLLLRLPLGVIVVAALLFIPAGSLKFWQGWAYMACFFIPLLFSFCYLYRHDPQLLERRMQVKEKVREQKLFQALSPLIFSFTLLLSGLDHRFGWSRTSLRPVPLWLTLLSQALLLGGILLIFWVMKVNSFASRTVQVEAGQTVISSGPYRLVRHPMYSGGLVMYLSTPLALGSYVALPAFALFIPLIVFRLLNEEKVLRQELPGYAEYCLRTRFRLLPLVW
jgi:protein-S-isoprenylcysteine O-methyltransferase Ste14